MYVNFKWLLRKKLQSPKIKYAIFLAVSVYYALIHLPQSQLFLSVIFIISIIIINFNYSNSAAETSL